MEPQRTTKVVREMIGSKGEGQAVLMMKILEKEQQVLKSLEGVAK